METKNESLSIEQMIEIEPSLLLAHNYVKAINEEAKNKEIYWFRVWIVCKKMQDDWIGSNATNIELESVECWNTWHDHLKSLATNCL